MAAGGWRKWLRAWWPAGVVLLLVANVGVAVRWLGTRAGENYVWVCRDSEARLSYNPSVFGRPGRASLVPGPGEAPGGHRWELVAPERPSPWLPWNWLAVLLDRPVPDPDAVIRQERLGPHSATPVAEPGRATDHRPPG